MKIIPPNEIPPASEVQDVSLDNPMAVYRVCQEMQEICGQNNGVGLSAVQLGLSQRLFLIDYNGQCNFYVNCDYEPLSEDTINVVEGCLSLRDEKGKFPSYDVVRYRDIRVKGWKLNVDVPEFEPIDLELRIDRKNQFHPEDEWLGVVFQHEIDHQKGILISDIGREMVVW
jgi:peptide deformylase